ncbi:diacylglycerol kinase [Paenibacillus albilobatus]|uniref:Diacylglycerol kinase n=1 Tax=Paenibacillus albilobatus TaxID=2716884 RepID=A0A919XJ11_9BACL|nr:diacylglycerol kinase family protein [Paenibacillus albilobatus]GIO32288.1 diacylglycerol kinase [Paenibacillus albilobatus]
MYLFVINKKAGNGQGYRAWIKIRAVLDARLIRYRYVFTESSSHAEDVIAAMLSEPEPWLGVAVIGGDGTIHSVLPVLKEFRIPLAVIPAGSGNDTARGFGIPHDPLSALDIMLGGQTRAADLIATANGLTLTALAIGFDAQVAENVNASLYKKICNVFRVGRAAYLVGILHTLLTFKPCGVTVTCDGNTSTYQNAWLTAVSNVKSYGGGLHICPEAHPGDGQLDVCIVHGCSRLQLLRLFPTVLTGRHVRLPFVTFLRGKAVSVAFDQLRLALGDGENMSEGTLDITVQPNALQVYAV